MPFSSEWNKKYAEREKQNGTNWPWSDLISLFYRHTIPLKKNTNVLELGCGAGSNIPFFESLNVNYFGIDGSLSTINNLKERFPKLKENLVQGDFTQKNSFNEKFDIVIDRSSLTHNSTKDIIKTLDNISEQLNKKGKYFGIDWFSTSHSEYGLGTKIVDEFTRDGYENGQFAGYGEVHFSDKNHILELFSEYEILSMQHKIIQTEIPDLHQMAFWNFVAEKL